jgi:hypothetical protein
MQPLVCILVPYWCVEIVRQHCPGAEREKLALHDRLGRLFTLNDTTPRQKNACTQ